MRTTVAKLLFVASVSAVLALGANPEIGTWKLNLAKSRYDPGPPPFKSFSLKMEPLENGEERITASGEDHDGKPMNSTFTIKYDGKDYPATNTPFDHIAVTRLDPNTVRIIYKKDGKVMSRAISKISGKTMTETGKGVGPDGKVVSSVEVYERQ